MSIGHTPSHPQHTPDMRKDASDVTEEDKKEAKRRIQGSAFADDESGGDASDEVSNDVSRSHGVSQVLSGATMGANLQ
jgi:hypothetical protein